jgi:hypothetical protein
MSAYVGHIILHFHIDFKLLQNLNVRQVAKRKLGQSNEYYSWLHFRYAAAQFMNLDVDCRLIVKLFLDQ